MFEKLKTVIKEVERIARECFFSLCFARSFPFDELTFGKLFQECANPRPMQVSVPISYVFKMLPSSDIQFRNYAAGGLTSVRRGFREGRWERKLGRGRATAGAVVGWAGEEEQERRLRCRGTSRGTGASQGIEGTGTSSMRRKMGKIASSAAEAAIVAAVAEEILLTEWKLWVRMNFQSRNHTTEAGERSMTGD